VGPGQPLFEIGVYRLSPDDWYAELESRITQREQEFTETAWPFLGRQPSAEEHDRFRCTANEWARGIERVYGGWQYNETVGWVRLYWDGPGPVVKGYLWHVGYKKVNSGPRRRFQRGFIPFPFIYGEAVNNKVLEEWFDDRQTDREIYKQLRQGLVQIVARDGELPGRHLDLSMFDAVGPTVRWQGLIVASDS
jgi:hypothetical protein